MRFLGGLLVVAGLAAVAGCTHHSLQRHTVLTTSTVMDIQYNSVLANLAMLSCQPEALPNHVHLADGVVQVNDRAGLGTAGGFTTFGGTMFGIDQFGPAGQRQVTEQWGTDATTDPGRLYDLQSLYRSALGLPPLPVPNAITYLRRTDSAADDSEDSAESSSGAPSPASAGGGGSTLSGGNGASGDNGRRVPLDVLLSDVPPPGWYRIGRKQDVPKNACYVGHWGDRYAWVTRDGVPDLARFTTTVLFVIQLKPGERGGSSGLAVTGAQ
ncbi:hypothetical protein [Botrimarina sp.]|uniref:hypothetical protein n=1 Tax=Botrimarina sp. TaxID=2795802 RepID=UPI0032EF066D